MFLAKADVEIQAAGADLGAAAACQDLEAMWGAADGLATLVKRLQTQVPRIADYPMTASAAKAYEAAFPDMLAGATLLRDSITAGDSPGVVEGSQQLSAGLEKYAEARRLIGPLFDQADPDAADPGQVGDQATVEARPSRRRQRARQPARRQRAVAGTGPPNSSSQAAKAPAGYAARSALPPSACARIDSTTSPASTRAPSL